jgi:C4-dicarboxylate transporter, DctQ subunit
LTFAKRFLPFWDRAEVFLAGLLALLALAAAFYQVVTRYFFNWAPEWAEESVLYLVIWAVFIIASKLVREDHHVGADFIIQKLPLRVQRTVAIATSILALAFCILVIFYGTHIVSVALGIDERSPTRMRFPMWIAYLSVPVGCTLVSLSYLYRLYLLIFKFEARTLARRAHEDRRAQIT